MSADRVAVLLAAGAAPWERAAIEALDRPGGRVVLLKRCLDLTDLLATAAAGSSQVAVVADGLSGLDADSVQRLGHHGVRVLVVSAAEPRSATAERLMRLGAASVVDVGALTGLAARVLAAAAQDGPAGSARAAGTPEGPTPGERGRLVAVWGPHGAPGRTTVAVALAAEAAAAGVPTTLVDADPYGGAVTHHLAVLDEVSGLLAAARAANAGELDPDKLARLARQVGSRLRVLTGLPRPDRWTEVRPQAFGDLLEVARHLDDLVVVDCGPGLPDLDGEPFPEGPDRDAMTAAALEAADLAVAVGGADPVGLTRLARTLAEALGGRPRAATRVVVNRMRPTLGWSRADVEQLLAGVAPDAPVSFVPDDRAAADRALVAGRPLVECGDSRLRAALRQVARDVLTPLELASPPARQRWPRPRGTTPRRGRGRPRGGKRAARKGQTLSSR